MGPHKGNAAVVDEGSKEEALPPRLFVPFQRFITVELVLYFGCLSVCLSTTFFAAGDVPISLLIRRLRRQIYGPPQKILSQDPFEVLAKASMAKKLNSGAPSHELSADLVLTLLVPFLFNALILALMRRINDVVADERKKQEKENKEASSNSVATVKGNKSSGKEHLPCAVDADRLLKNTLFAASGLLCVVIPVCVLTQPGSEVRSFGPCSLLFSIVIDLCALEAHGGLHFLQSILNFFQALTVLALAFLVVVANTVPKADL